MAIVAADYQVNIAALQRVLANGGHLSDLEHRILIQLIRDSVTRMNGGSVALDAITDVLVVEAARVATVKAAMVTAIASVAGLDIATITGNITAAAGLIAALVATWSTQNTSLGTFATNAGAQIVLLDAFEAALGTAPVLIANTVADGGGNI